MKIIISLSTFLFALIGLNTNTNAQAISLLDSTYKWYWDSNLNDWRLSLKLVDITYDMSRPEIGLQ